MVTCLAACSAPAARGGNSIPPPASTTLPTPSVTIATWTPPASWAPWSQPRTPIVASALRVTPTPYACPTPSGGTPVSDDASQFHCIRVIRPPEPLYLVVAADAGALVVQWLGTGLETTTHYDVYRQSGDTGAWQRVVSVEATRENREQYIWHDRDVTPGTTYRYGVLSVEQFGHQSPLVVSDPRTVP